MLTKPAALTSDVDLWSDQALIDPYPYYRALRDQGPIVWLDKVNAWGAFRFGVAKEILGKPSIFSSANGVMLNDSMNRATADAGVILCTDDPRHRELRRIFTRPLSPAAVSKLSDRLNGVMTSQVEKLLELRSFDAVQQIAQILPLAVISELVGLSEEGKASMLDWAGGTFNAFGPAYSARTVAGLQIVGVAFNYVNSVPRESLDPNGWGAALFEAVDRGELEVKEARSMLADYLVPALDTTISAMSSAIMLFGQNPDQWALVREDAALIPDAINEVIRLYSPIRGFGRQATEDCELDGVLVRAGERVQVFYASANRDERHYADPDRFLITRKARDNVGFGYGHHLCAGMHLAKLEITTVLTVLAKYVVRFSIDSISRPIHNTLTVIDRLNVTIEPAVSHQAPVG